MHGRHLQTQSALPFHPHSKMSCFACYKPLAEHAVLHLQGRHQSTGDQSVQYFDDTGPACGKLFKSSLVLFLMTVGAGVHTGAGVHIDVGVCSTADMCTHVRLPVHHFFTFAPEILPSLALGTARKCTKKLQHWQCLMQWL